MPINVWWTRDQFIGGLDELKETFDKIIEAGKVQDMLGEKAQSVELWKKVVALSKEIECNDTQTKQYIEVSSEYGLLLYSIYEKAWQILLTAYQAEQAGTFRHEMISDWLSEYDNLWQKYDSLYSNNSQCATLYKPYSFVFTPPDFHGEAGLKSSIEYYRNLK